jgi:uncharacterized protein
MLRREIYVFEHRGKFVVFAPLKSKVATVSRLGLRELLKCIQDDRRSDFAQISDLADDLLSPNCTVRDRASAPERRFHPTYARLILTTRCNLRCIYCYSAAEQRGLSMPSRTAETAIDVLFDNAVRDGKESVTLEISGGGEPSTEWALLVSTLRYARGREAKTGVKLLAKVSTNGVLDEEGIAWLADNVDSVQLSLDGFAAIQNKQRPLANGAPSFDRVSRTATVLNERKRSFVIRTTVTSENAHLLSEIVDFLQTQFDHALIHLEPVTTCGRCTSTGCQTPFDEFRASLKKALRSAWARQKDIYLGGTPLTSPQIGSCGLCDLTVVVLPSGEITACPVISSFDEPRSAAFLIGRVGAAGLSFDKGNVAALASSVVAYWEECDDCFAKWHCSGGCLAARIHAEGRAAWEARCSFVRDVFRFRLLALADGRWDGGKEAVR